MNRVWAASLAAALWLTGCQKDDQTIVLATTTSVEDSGLLGVLLDAFVRDHAGYQVRPLAVGSGQALELGRRKDADLLLVHLPGEEERFVADGYGVDRVPLMYNDFVVVGPPDDPAEVSRAADAAGALGAIAEDEAPFLSRGDGSGTHGREIALWAAAGVTPEGAWYRDAGQGMGPLLQMASETRSYTLSDRATFSTMSNHLDLDILFEGDPELVNVYSVIRVVDAPGSETARVLWHWLTSEAGRQRIDGFRASGGEALFRSLLVGDGLPFAAWSSDRSNGAAPGRSPGRDPLVARGSLLLPDSIGRWGLLEELFRRVACRSVPPSQTGPACSRATSMEVSEG